MTCVNCGQPIPTPTPDPFRCPKCRGGNVVTEIISAVAPNLKQCERCGIDEDDPRARQACAAVDSDSPYHRFAEALPFVVEDEDDDREPCELCHTSPCVCHRDDDGKRVGPLR